MDHLTNSSPLANVSEEQRQKIRQQSAKNKGAKEETRKQQRKIYQIKLRKEQRSLDLERRRHLTTFNNFSQLNGEYDVPVEYVVEQLIKYCAAGESGGDEVDFGSVHNSVRSETAIHCLRMLQEKIKQENSPKPSVTIPTSSSLIGAVVSDQMLWCYIHLLNIETTNNSFLSNRTLLHEVVATLHLITQFACTEQLRKMAVKYIHQPLLAILNQQNASQFDIKLCTNAFYCLSFIAANHIDFSILLINDNYVSTILKHLEYALFNCRKLNDEEELNYVRSIALSAKVITQNINADTRMSQLISDLLPSLMKMLSIGDEIVTSHVIWTVSSSIVSRCFRNSDLVIKSNLIPQLIGYTLNSSDSLKDAAISALANITACSDFFAVSVVSCNFLLNVSTLLVSNEATVQHETVKVLNNIINADASMIKKISEYQLMSSLLDLLHLGDYKTQKEVTFLFGNIILNDYIEEAVELLNGGIIGALTIQLTVAEVEVIEEALKIFERLLLLEKRGTINYDVANKCDQNGVFRQMEPLCNHPNNSISELTDRLFETYIDPRESLTSCGMDSVESSFSSNQAFHVSGFGEQTFSF